MLSRGWEGEANFAPEDVFPVKDLPVLLGGMIMLSLLWFVRRH